MKAPIITITLFAAIILTVFYSNAQTELISFDSQVAKITLVIPNLFWNLYPW